LEFVLHSHKKIQQKKTTSSNNVKSIDCHLKLDGIKGESTREKNQTTAQYRDIDYSYKPQKADGTSRGDNSSTENEEPVVETKEKKINKTGHVTLMK
jgi:hypothetical protein